MGELPNDFPIALMHGSLRFRPRFRKFQQFSVAAVPQGTYIQCCLLLFWLTRPGRISLAFFCSTKRQVRQIAAARSTGRPLEPASGGGNGINPLVKLFRRVWVLIG